MNEITEDTDFPVMVRRSDWSRLQTGQAVTVAEHGHPGSNGTIDDITPDASILWVRLAGASPRRMFMCTDPVMICPTH